MAKLSICYNCGASVVFQRRESLFGIRGMLFCPECLVEVGDNVIMVSDRKRYDEKKANVDFESVYSVDQTEGTGF